MTGVVLVALFAIVGVSLVSLGQLLSVHVFVGMLLIPPIALKLGSTGYRFLRYYTGSRAYRRAGPPGTLMRMLGPVVIAATAALFVSGVAMLALGPSDHRWLVGLHKASFLVWVAVVAVHVLGHLIRIGGLASADFRAPPDRRQGSLLRQGAIAVALVAGLVLAVETVHYAAPWRALLG
jgi:Na+/phosphate symporter